MASFDNGVSSYVHATATVDVYFPVDDRGNAHITCRHCYYYREASHRCGLNYEICSFPDKYVGDNCPLEPITDENGEINNNTEKEN